MNQYASKMKKYFVKKKVLIAALLSFVLQSISISFLHKGTEAATSDIYNLKETIENMQNSTITMENQTNQTTTDNQTDKIIPGVPEPI
jgi:mannitol-specific phosphotransferase system IIBC component